MRERELRELMSQMWYNWSPDRIQQFKKRLLSTPELSDQSKSAMGKYCDDIIEDRRRSMLSLVS